MQTLCTHLYKVIGKKLHEFMYYFKNIKEMNSITLQNKLLTFPKKFACNPSLTAEVLINLMRESHMLISLSYTLGCSKNRLTSRQRADLTTLGKSSSRKESGFLPCLVLFSSFQMLRVFPASSFMSSQESAWYMRKIT
jgi:hypothetical protein